MSRKPFVVGGLAAGIGVFLGSRASQGKAVTAGVHRISSRRTDAPAQKFFRRSEKKPAQPAPPRDNGSESMRHSESV